MRGIYTVNFFEQTIAAASGDYDFFEIIPATNKPLEIVGIWIGNKSEVGDAQDEMVSYTIVRGNTTTGNGSSATPGLTDSSDPAASFTAKTVSSTPAVTAGTVLCADTFNIRAGLNLLFPELMRIKVSAADTRLCVRLPTALADDAVFSGTLWVREI